MSGWTAVKSLLERGVSEGVYPSAQACVIREGRTLFDAAVGEATSATQFDLASLTKVVCTTSAFMALWGEGKLGPGTEVARYFPESPLAKAGATVADLLYHRSGLPAFRPFFARVMPAVPELFDAKCPESTWSEVRSEVIRAASQAGLEAAPGARAVYSDLGFILLGDIIERASSQTLDAYFQARVASKWGLRTGFRRISSHLSTLESFAPTGTTRPRPPALGQEKMWEPFPARPSTLGEVDDDNAWVMDGVSGHAGLFGTALEVARFGQGLISELGGASQIAPGPLWARAFSIDTSTPHSTRALGFDTPARDGSGSSAGALLGKGVMGAVGHLGFTGVSLWVDLDLKLSIALLTNRVLLGRENLRIREFRPAFHDAVALAAAAKES